MSLPLLLIGSENIVQAQTPALENPSLLENTAVGVVIAAGGAIFLQAVFKELTVVIRAFAAWIPKVLEDKQVERTAKTDAFTNLVEQNEKLFEEIKRRDEALELSNKTNHAMQQTALEGQRLFNQQNDLFNQERVAHKEDMKKMIESLDQEKKLVEALKETNQKLLEENVRLRAQLIAAGLDPDVPTNPVKYSGTE